MLPCEGVADDAAAPVPLPALVGSRLVVGMDGTTPSPALIERIRGGRVGGVILMGANVRTAAQVRALTASLRAAARSGGRRILIATDQEGGLVRRFRWAPPVAAAEELGRLTEVGDPASRARDRQRSSASASTSTWHLSPTYRACPGRSSPWSAAGSRRFLHEPQRE